MHILISAIAMFEGLDLGTYDLGLHYITDLLYATFLIFAGGLALAG